MRKSAVPPDAYPAHRPCPVCGEDRPRAVFDNRMAPLDRLDMSYRVSQCAGCAFHYASDLPLPASYASYYRTMSKYDLPGTGGVSSSARQRFEAALSLSTRHLPADALIIDVGCGSGALLGAFKAAGYSHLYGIDPAPGAPREAARQFGLQHVVSGSLRDADQRLPLAQCDLLCLTGVAEHLPELSEDFAALLTGLADKALVLIEVPALERFAAAAFEPFGEFSLEHIQYFSQPSLDRLLMRFGYTPLDHLTLRCTGCTDSLFGLYGRSMPDRSADAGPPPSLTDYIERSGETWHRVLQKIARHPGPFIIFGAGSHSARLLPALDSLGMASRIVGIVDNNPNLHGVALGGHRIHPRDFLARQPGMTVLISSFRAQSAIAEQLADRHPCLCLYDLPR